MVDEESPQDGSTVYFKGPVFYHIQMFIFHPGLQWSNLAQVIIQKTLDLPKTAYVAVGLQSDTPAVEGPMNQHCVALKEPVVMDCIDVSTP